MRLGNCTGLLTPWSRVLLEKLTGFAANQGIPLFYGPRKFITVLTSVRHNCTAYVVGSKSFRPDQLFKVTEIKQLCYFSTSLPLLQHTFHICELVTLDGTIYPSQHFPFGAAFVCQAGNFWTTLLRT